MHGTWCIYMYVYVCTYREHRKELTDFKLQDKERKQKETLETTLNSINDKSETSIGLVLP